MRYDKRDTILAKNLKLEVNSNLNDKLNEMLRRIEFFVKINNYYPKQLLLNEDTFDEILENKKELLNIKDEQYYLFNLKIVF